MKVQLKICQRHLATLWLIASAILFCFVLLQTTLGRYTDDGAAWNWLLPAILPTASLIVTALFKTSSAEEKTADRFLYRLSFFMSLAYLLTLTSVLMLQPLTTAAPEDALKHSNIYLAPFQGLVASAVGAFFGQTEKEQPDHLTAATEG